MNKKNLILSIVALLILGAILIFVKIPTNNGVGVEAPENNVRFEAPDLNILPVTFDAKQSPKDQAWYLFQKYLAYNKQKNLAGVKSVVYKLSPLCESPDTVIDCEARMGSAYSYGNPLNKKDFVNVWSDEKQIILSTNFWTEDSDDMGVIGRFRSIIYFIKDENGNLKLLSFSPTKGGATEKGTAGEEELSYRIIRYTEDNDQDGIEDYTEECLAVKEGQTCLKTDPTIRDTDNDGFWDGVEVLMK